MLRPAKVEGDPKRCYCRDIRLPYVHHTTDHAALRQAEQDTIRNNRERLHR